MTKEVDSLKNRIAELERRLVREADQITRISKLESANRRLKAEHTNLVHELDLSEKRYAAITAMKKAPAPTILRPARRRKRRATALVMASDWHVEETVEADKVNGLNEFNLDVAATRIERFTRSTMRLIDWQRSGFDIDDLFLWLGGDLMSGYIHEELVEGNALSPTETVMWLFTKLRFVIDTLREHVKRILISCSYGNHGRTTKRMRIGTASENSYEWLLYQMLAQHYDRTPRVTVHAPRSLIQYVTIYDRVIRTTHGDAVRYGGGVGGIMIPLNKAIAAWDARIPADLTILGHWHQRVAMPGVLVNGSLIGHSPYADFIKARYEPPTQNFCLIDSEYGKTADFPIVLDKDQSRKRGAA